VQVAEYVDGRRRILKHFGSAHDQAGLGLLIAQATRWLAGELQDQLDLGVDTPVGQARLLGQESAERLLPAWVEPVRTVGRPVSKPRVLASVSQLLYGLVGSVYSDLGFDVLDDGVFKDLVIARVVEPTSLSDVDRVLGELGVGDPASLSSRKRSLKRACDGSYRNLLAQACYRRVSGGGDMSLVLYDVTTLRTQAEYEDGFRKVGFSKERSVDPQVVVGLLADRSGFPLEIGSWEGNKAEKHTIVPIVEAFSAAHPDLDQLVVVADAGMLSATNLKTLDDAGHRFIVGSRTSKGPIDLESHFRWHGDAFTDGQVIDTITPKIGANSENDPASRPEPVWDPNAHPGSWRAVWQYSAKRFARDNRTLTAQENRARAAIEGDKPARTPRFVKTTAKGLKLDEKSLARARQMAGLKGYVTNIPVTIMEPKEVLDSYHDLWHIEESFRISKNDLAARPFFARKQDAIQAHLTIVFAALAIARTIQQRTGLSLRRVLRILRPLRSAVIETNGTLQTIPPAINTEQQQLIAATQNRLRH
jgi:hypothetical protein